MLQLETVCLVCYSQQYNICWIYIRGNEKLNLLTCNVLTSLRQRTRRMKELFLCLPSSARPPKTAHLS